MEHRRGVHSGAVCARSASGCRRQDERTRGGQAVRAGSRDRAEDAAVFGAAGLSAAATGAAAEAGRLGRRHRSDPGKDKAESRKQRHTAKRIFERLRDEHGYTGGYTIVKDYVRLRKLSQREMFVPLAHPPGDAQADFGEALVVIGGVERKAHYLAMDLPQSDDCFVMAFPAETTEAFLEGHNHAFAYFGGVPRTILYDNTKIAVAQILGDGDAKEDASVQRTAEPLSVRGEVRTSRQGQRQRESGRAGGLRAAELHGAGSAVRELGGVERTLAEQCQKRRERKLRGHSETIARAIREGSGEAAAAAAGAVRSLRQAHHAGEFACRWCGIETNDYSVPVEWGHREVLVKGFVQEVVICCGQRGDCAARQELRAGGNDFQSAALSGTAGAEEQCAGSGGAASGLAVAGRVPATAPADGSTAGQTRAGGSTCRCCGCWRPFRCRKWPPPSTCTAVSRDLLRCREASVAVPDRAAAAAAGSGELSAPAGGASGAPRGRRLPGAAQRGGLVKWTRLRCCWSII